MSRQGNSTQRRPKLLIILIISLIIIGAGFYFISSTPHRQAVSVARTFIKYEESGDYGSAWGLLDSRLKTQINQATYINLRSQLYFDSLKAHAFQYKIDNVRHYKTWHPDKTSKVLTNVYQITVEQQFKSQFGEQKLITELYLTKDKKAHNNWRILWDQT